MKGIWEYFEKILRQYRIRHALPIIQKYNNCKVLDIGCGRDAEFLRASEPYISYGIGIDFKTKLIHTDKIKTIVMKINGHLPFSDKSFNIVSMLAVLEHLDNPDVVLQEISRVLSDDGRIIITVPSKKGKPILETLTNLNLVDINEIKDHKNYFNKEDIKEVIKNTPLEIEKHQYFQLGCNNFCVLKKC